MTPINNFLNYPIPFSHIVIAFPFMSTRDFLSASQVNYFFD